MTKRVTANQEQYAAASEDRKSAAEEQAMLTEEAGKVAADRRANCEQAKDQQEQYSTARRLYRDFTQRGAGLPERQGADAGAC